MRGQLYRSTTSPSVGTLTSIYNAAISPTGWDDVLDRCAIDTGAYSGAFFSYKVNDLASYSLRSVSKEIRERAQREPDLMPEYFSEIAPIEDIIHKYVLTLPQRQILLDSEQWPDRACPEARFHDKWLKNRLGIGLKLAARLNNNPRIHELFVLHFATGQLVPDCALSTLTSLLPHLAKSAEMSVMYNALEQRYSAVLSVLDRVGVGLCVLDPNGRVIVSNTEAMRIFDADHGLRIDNNRRLNCTNKDDQVRLVNAIDAALLDKDTARAEALLALRRDHKSDPVLVEISPLRDTLDELNCGLEGVLVQLVDSGSRTHCSVHAFANAYGLSQAEQTVTEYLLDGLTNPQIAEERSTSVETVKTQIASVMKKVDARSRVELVRRILKTQTPILEP